MRKTLTIENKTHFLINPYHNLITWPAPVPTTRFEPTAILLGDKCTYHQAKVETNLSYKTIVTNHDPILGRFLLKIYATLVIITMIVCSKFFYISEGKEVF